LKQNADLHKALKGGNNNFGIVTRFDLEAFPQGPVWGGSIVQLTKEPTFSWFQDFANSSKVDLDAQMMYSAMPLPGSWSSVGFVTYSKNVTNPEIFKDFWSNAAMSSATRTTYNTIAQMNALLTPSGDRTAWATFSFINSAKFMRTVLELAPEESKSLPTFSSGIQLIFQPLWKAPRAKILAEKGGNSLGLDEQDDLVIALVSVSWFQPADDLAANAGLKNFIDKVTRLAKEAGVYSRYLYLNYAAEFQDPIAGYGEKSRAELISVSRKYDPIQLFQKRVPGGFKLSRG
jgi:hypothetical protein